MSWKEGSAIPSQEELNDALEELRAAKASARETERRIDLAIADSLVELSRDGMHVAGLDLPPQVLAVLRAIKRGASLLQLVPLEGAGVDSSKAGLVRQVSEAIERAASSLGA